MLTMIMFMSARCIGNRHMVKYVQDRKLLELNGRTIPHSNMTKMLKKCMIRKQHIFSFNSVGFRLSTLNSRRIFIANDHIVHCLCVHRTVHILSSAVKTIWIVLWSFLRICRASSFESWIFVFNLSFFISPSIFLWLLLFFYSFASSFA